jgi:hypothetical protein
VRITHPTLKVPPRYNEESTLGIEILPTPDPFKPLHLDLKASDSDR